MLCPDDTLVITLFPCLVCFVSPNTGGESCRVVRGRPPLVEGAALPARRLKISQKHQSQVDLTFLDTPQGILVALYYYCYSRRGRSEAREAAQGGVGAKHYEFPVSQG